uniref:Major facilitator superfamily (MFS) profile domain-containing protein n=1 Tax=Fagus sylvatica TaxID=28930 RepID=A0A2N9G200_FAGSY
MATFFRILKDKPYLIKFAFSVGLSGAIYGIISRAITSSSPYMNQHADKTILFLLPILSNVAPIIGSILGGLMIDSKGRRDVVMGSDILILLGCFLTASILKPEIILMSRVLIGIGFGLSSVATPLYLMEVAPTEIRGSFASDDSPDPLPTLNALTRIYSPERALEEYNILRDMIDSIKANEVDIGNTFWRKVKSGFRTAGVGESLSAIATSMATLVVSLMFSPIQNSLGSSSIFFLNAGFALFGVILLYFILPETNGVRLERMDNGIQLAIIDNVMPEEHPQNEDMGLQEGPQNEDPELPMLSKHRINDDDDSSDGEGDCVAENGKAEESKKVKAKKPKKPKVTVSDAAAKIDADDLSAFLADITASYQGQQESAVSVGEDVQGVHGGEIRRCE